MFIPLIYGRHIFIHAQKHLLSVFLHDWPGLPYPLLCRTIRWCSYNTQAQHTFHTFPDMVFALQRDVWPGIISLTPLHHIVSFSFNIISSFLLLVCQLNACKSTSCLTHQYDLISKLLLSQLSVIILEWWWNCCWWQSMEGMSGATAADTNQSEELVWGSINCPWELHLTCPRNLWHPGDIHCMRENNSKQFKW